MVPLLREKLAESSTVNPSVLTGRINASLLLLAGGRGFRMGGRNKLYLEVEGSLLLERTLGRIASLFEEKILLVAAGESATVKQRISPLLDKWDLSIVEDRAPNRGPLEGLYMGLSSMKTEWGFILGCDMPNPQEKIIRIMHSFCSTDLDAVIAETGGYIEPLHAFYRRSCLDSVGTAITKGDRRIKQFYNDVRIRIINEEVLKKYGDCDYVNSFINLNTPHDIETMIKTKEVTRI